MVSVAVNPIFTETEVTTMFDEAKIIERLESLEKHAVERLVGLDAEVRELKQRGADRFTGQSRKADTVYTRIAGSDQVAALLRRETRSAVVDLAGLSVKSLISGDVGSPLEPGNTFTDPSRLPGVAFAGMRMPRVADLFLAIPAATNAAIATTEADVTPPTEGQANEGATKPAGGILYQAVERPIVTLPAWVRVSEQVLSDQPALESAIRARLLNMLVDVLERQLVVGDGSTGNMSGITQVGNHAVHVPASGDTPLDTIRRARTQVELADFSPNAVVLHPSDWESIELEKTSTDAYVAGEGGAMRFIGGGMGDQVWRMTVALSRSMPVGKFAVMDSAAAAYIADRQSATIDLGFQNDDFVRNVVTMRAEMRAALVVTQSNAIRYGDLTT